MSAAPAAITAIVRSCGYRKLQPFNSCIDHESARLITFADRPCCSRIPHGRVSMQRSVLPDLHTLQRTRARLLPLSPAGAVGLFVTVGVILRLAAYLANRS